MKKELVDCMILKQHSHKHTEKDEKFVGFRARACTQYTLKKWTVDVEIIC